MKWPPPDIVHLEDVYAEVNICRTINFRASMAVDRIYS